MQKEQTQNNNPEQSYFAKRMAEIGFDEKKHFITIPGEFPIADIKQPYFQQEPDGSIRIYYSTIAGDALTYVEDKREKTFFRKRYTPEQAEKVNFKYWQPADTGINIYIPFNFLKLYKSKNPIKTLFVVEGEFKAWVADQHNIPIIGIGGKDLFIAEKKGELHPVLKKIIKQKKVENICLVLDNDLYQVTWNKETEPDKDLGERLHSFFSTVKNFRELTKELVTDVYLVHPNEDFAVDNIKGIDDLLIVEKDKETAVYSLLSLSTRKNKHFKIQNISNETVSTLRGMFFCNYYSGVPKKFHERFAAILGTNEFCFLRGKYKYDGDTGKLETTKHQDSEKFIRVGCDYAKIIYVPNSEKLLTRKLQPWKKGELQTDYVHQGHKNFITTIPKYDSFCNVPYNKPDEYKQVVEGCYNLYYPLQYKSKKGTWQTIENYLKHLFGTEIIASGHTNFDLAMDWFTINHLMPTEKLPIICPVSVERGTGKSTILFFMRECYGENATIIGNQEIKDNYNDDWISRLIIGVDEGFIEKKETIEKIKSMATNKKAKFHAKFGSKIDVDFIGKFIITSNDEKDFIRVDKRESRFWVNHVPVIKTEDPFLLEKMTEEIPAFFWELENRTILHKKESRLWFKPELFITNAFRAVAEHSLPTVIKNLKSLIADVFFEFPWHTHYFTIKQLETMLYGCKSDSKASYLKDTFKEHLKLVPYYGRKYIPSKNAEELKDGLRATTTTPGHWYIFHIEDYLTAEEIKSICIDIEIVEKIRSGQLKENFCAYNSVLEIPENNTLTNTNLTNEEDLPF